MFIINKEQILIIRIKEISPTTYHSKNKEKKRQWDDIKSISLYYLQRNN